jgi:hypothetical protein
MSVKKKIWNKKIIFILEFRKVVRLKLEKGKKVSCLKVIPLNSFFLEAKYLLNSNMNPPHTTKRKQTIKNFEK